MHSQPKEKPAPKTPCCKELRAVVSKCVAANPALPLMTGLHDYATAVVPLLARTAVEIRALETGPPGCLSFAESVLQESMLSHAPPVS